jgi:DNA-binding MarR family transcriptional regulator
MSHAQTTTDAQADAIQIKASLGRTYRHLRRTKVTGGLTMPESSALSTLDRYGPATAASLAKLEHITPQSIGVTLASLEASGLVQRERDPADGRRVILSLTEGGQELLAHKRSVRTEQLTRALEGLTMKERAQLVDAMPLLERLAELIQ